MNTDHYRVLFTISKTKNISKAAELLGYTQSGVSHIINNLEKFLNLTLLHREHSGVMLTEETEAVLPIIESLLEAENRLFYEAKIQASGKKGSIRIATIQSIASLYLPHIIHEFINMYPNISIEIIEKSKYPEIEKLLLDGKADCAFTISPENSTLKFKSLFTDGYSVAMPKEHPLTAFPSLDPKQLENYPFIIPEEGINNKTLADIISRMTILENIKTNSLDDSITFSMIEKGLGISIVPNLIAETLKNNVATRPLKGSFRRYIGIVSAADAAVSPALDTFMNFSAEWFCSHFNKKD